eukprot:263942-Pyramimonas_sp.AAC.1
MKGAVSLAIKPDGHPVLIIWAQPEVQMGRPMRIDEWGRIIALAAWLQPEADFRDAAVVVADTGMAQTKAPRKLRAHAEPWVLLLRLQAHTRLHQGPLVPPPKEKCAVCAAEVEADPRAVLPDELALYYRCQSCLL